MDGVTISARSNGILVERILQNVVIDRYNTSDLTKPIKRNDPWIERVRTLCSQESAKIVIEVPPVPTLEMSQAEKLEALTASNNERRFIIESGKRLMSLNGGEPHVECPECCGVCDPVIVESLAGTITGELIEMVGNAEAEAERVRKQNSYLEL